MTSSINVKFSEAILYFFVNIRMKFKSNSEYTTPVKNNAAFKSWDVRTYELTSCYYNVVKSL